MLVETLARIAGPGSVEASEDIRSFIDDEPLRERFGQQRYAHTPTLVDAEVT